MTRTMVGRLSECVLLAFRTPAESVRDLIPAELELVTHNRWAFWNIVACRVERMRPVGLPAFLGVSYYHLAYRLYVRTRAATPEPLDALFFVKSEVDSRLMAVTGNWFTDFRFHEADIEMSSLPDHWSVWSESRTGDDGDTVCRTHPASSWLLPKGSCFASVEEARHVLKYQPLGLSVDAERSRIKLAEVFRDESRWQETPLGVEQANWPFFDRLGQHDVHLELATRVAPIDYRWRLGRAIALSAHRKPPRHDRRAKAVHSLSSNGA